MADNSKPVVVYGASGYTGRLICEYLREYDVPFVAAGRDGDKLKTSMESNVAGIETADYEIVEVEHDVEALTELFAGASVVCNTVGPFSKFGPEVVEACLAAGVHYLDTTGEQDWLITCDEQYGADFAAAGLLLAPGVAQMYTTGEIAAEVASSSPASTPSTSRSSGAAARPSPRRRRSWSTPRWPARSTSSRTRTSRGTRTPASTSWSSRASTSSALALPWGGTSHPVWYRRDPRVANVKALGGVFNRALMHGVPQIVAAAIEATKDMEPDEKYAALDRHRGPGDERDAAPGEPAAQQVAGLGARLRTARPGALRHPRQPELQADRPAAGLRGVLPAAAAAEAGRLRLGLPGVRPPRAARRAAQLRPGRRAGAHASRADRGAPGRLPRQGRVARTRTRPA